MAKVFGKNFSVKHVFREKKKKYGQGKSNYRDMLYIRIGVGGQYTQVRSYTEEHIPLDSLGWPESYIKNDLRILDSLIHYYQETLSEEDFGVDCFVRRNSDEVKRLTSDVNEFCYQLEAEIVDSLLSGFPITKEIWERHGLEYDNTLIIQELNPTLFSKIIKGTRLPVTIREFYNYYCSEGVTGGWSTDQSTEKYYPGLIIDQYNPEFRSIGVHELLTESMSSLFSSALKLNGYSISAAQIKATISKYIREGKGRMIEELNLDINI